MSSEYPIQRNRARLITGAIRRFRSTSDAVARRQILHEINELLENGTLIVRQSRAYLAPNGHIAHVRVRRGDRAVSVSFSENRLSVRLGDVPDHIAQERAA